MRLCQQCNQIIRNDAFGSFCEDCYTSPGETMVWFSDLAERIEQNGQSEALVEHFRDKLAAGRSKGGRRDG